jgi:hypothetical protein
MKHGSTHTLKAIEKFALVVLRVTEIQDNESDQNRQENSHIISLHKGSQCLDDNASGIEARQPDSYATLIIGYPIRARIPMPRCAPPENRDDDTAKETEP